MEYLVVVTFLCIAVVKGTKDDGPYYVAKPGFGLPSEDLERGSYCRLRPGDHNAQCCPGRNDQCTMPFGDTLCYCDIFCNRTLTDCCPDFLGHCMGIDVPLGIMAETTHTTDVENNCYHHGHLYNPGDKIKENCNNCTCVDAIITEEYNWKCTQKICIVRQQVLHFVNNPAKKHSWMASNYSMFWGLSLNDGVKHWLGTQPPSSRVAEMSIVKIQVSDNLPENFDGRQEWPGLISPVLNQDSCASSWAFSTAGVASDRLSIHSNSLYKHTLSPQHLISCNTDHGQHGCNSGHIDRAWWFIRKVGIVSLECYPYRSGSTTGKATCSLPRLYSTLKDSKCPSGGSPTAVFQASPPYRVDSSETSIMKELIQNGPVQAVIEVKEDFFLYKSGVYQNILSEDSFAANARQTNFHSVRIIGWGTDHSTGKPVKYWLCANSWGSDWGEDGYFKILRGTNESKVESFVIGAWIKVNERMLIQKRKHHKDKN